MSILSNVGWMTVAWVFLFALAVFSEWQYEFRNEYRHHGWMMSYFAEDPEPTPTFAPVADREGALHGYHDACTHRMLGVPVCPRLFIIGAQKCGTTTLYHYLSLHRDFAPAWRLDGDSEDDTVDAQRPLKEVKYFNRPEVKMLPERERDESRVQMAVHYLPHFSNRTNPAQWSMDASPSYMYTSWAPTAMANVGFHHDARFIVILRDPIERAVSAMDKTIRNSDNSDRPTSYELNKVVKNCFYWLSKCKEDARKGNNGALGYFFCKEVLGYEVLYLQMCESWNRGFYADSLRQWIRAGIDGQKQFCFLRTSQLASGPEKVTEQLRPCLQGAGIDLKGFPKWETVNRSRFNIHNTTDRLSRTDPSTLKSMTDFYANSNTELGELLEQSFGLPGFSFSISDNVSVTMENLG